MHWIYLAGLQACINLAAFVRTKQLDDGSVLLVAGHEPHANNVHVKDPNDVAALYALATQYVRGFTPPADNSPLPSVITDEPLAGTGEAELVGGFDDPPAGANDSKPLPETQTAQAGADTAVTETTEELPAESEANADNSASEEADESFGDDPFGS